MLYEVITLYTHLGYSENEILFESRSGILKVKKENELLVLNFPSSDVESISLPDNLKTAFGVLPLECYKGRDDLMLLFNSEKDIEKLTPHFTKIMESNTRGVICTAQSESYDFVSRFFAPAVGVNVV